jgi:hypothetical protein
MYRDGSMLDSTKCVECPTGEYQAETGTTYCLGCDAGTYADQKSSSLCKTCPSGKFVGDKRSKTADACLDCPASTVPNGAHSECIDPGTLAGIGCVPSKLQQKIEDGIYKYQIKMNDALEADETVDRTSVV